MFASAFEAVVLFATLTFAWGTGYLMGRAEAVECMREMLEVTLRDVAHELREGERVR